MSRDIVLFFSRIEIVFIAVCAHLLIQASDAEAASERRSALIVAVDDYRLVRPLENAHNDARALEQALKALGFRVTLEENRDLRRIRRALEDFVEDGAGSDVALIFFAGHGVEIAGENRLLPTDANPATLESLKSTSLPLEEVRAAVNAVAPIGLIIVDACRTDPFGAGQKDRGTSRGVAGWDPAVLEVVHSGFGRVGKSENTLFAFSTSPGETALDGDTGNSPFSEALAKYIGTDGLEIRSVLTLVQQQVYDETHGRQLPYIESGLPKLFFARSSGGMLPERERLLLAMADITPARRALVEKIAFEKDVPLAPLFAALLTSGNKEPTDDELSAALNASADAFLKVRTELTSLAASDPDVAALRNVAERQLDLGAFDAARDALNKAAELDSKSRLSLKERLTERTVSEANTYYIIGGSEAARGRLTDALAAYRTAAALYDELQETGFDTDGTRGLLRALSAIATTELVRGGLSDAFDATNRLLTIVEAGAKQEPRSAFWQGKIGLAHALLGDLWTQLGSTSNAVKEFEAARTYGKAALVLDTANVEAVLATTDILAKLGRVKSASSDLPGALADLTEQLAVLKRLSPEMQALPALQHRMSSLYIEIGDLDMRLLQYETASSAYKAALIIRKSALDVNPTSRDARFEYGAALERTGDVYAATGEFDLAEKAYRSRHHIIISLVAENPEQTEIRRDLSVSYEKLGDFAYSRGHLDGAAENYRASLNVMNDMLSVQPENPTWRYEAALMKRKIADVLLAQREFTNALSEIGSAISIIEALVAKEPTNMAWQSELATAYNRSAAAYIELGQADSARLAYLKCLAIVQALADAFPSDPRQLWNLSLAHRLVAKMGDEPLQHLHAAVSILHKLETEGLLPQDSKGAASEAQKELDAVVRLLPGKTPAAGK